MEANYQGVSGCPKVLRVLGQYFDELSKYSILDEAIAAVGCSSMTAEEADFFLDGMLTWAKIGARTKAAESMVRYRKPVNLEEEGWRDNACRALEG